MSIDKVTTKNLMNESDHQRTARAKTIEINYCNFYYLVNATIIGSHDNLQFRIHVMGIFYIENLLTII